ncbi:hypothetical protein [Bacillus sp. FSL K6-0036]|uniref:hypothetical protein n=1 Tax=Bacillus sp. FSL K6-0036 TaxID=2921405 RepID=UPI0030FB94C2
MADKRESTDFIGDEKGNAEDVRKPADILRAVDFGNEKVNEVAASGGSIADVLRTVFEQMNAKRDSKTEPTATLNVEVSEAITGLKALQREAKAATKALAELREEQRALYDTGLYLDGKEIRRASFRKDVRR